MKAVLSIAGSDCSGGAGIQADIKTITSLKLYATTVVTALTAQNTMGVREIEEVSPMFIAEQLDAVFTDIVPDAVKIGMLSHPEVVRVVGQKLKDYGVTYLVVDPVMVATSGSRLLKNAALSTLVDELFPLATIITPNIPEAEVLSASKIRNQEEMLSAAQKLSQNLEAAILIKGGHLNCSADDLLWHKGQAHWLRAERIDNPNTHGTGCTLSAAIACGLAQGMSLYHAVEAAKAYVTGALRSGLNLGRGSGPLNHMYRLVLESDAALC